MEARIDYRRFAPEALQAMLALEKYIGACGFDHKLMHLLKLRASQMHVPPAKPNSGYTRSTRGAKRPFTTIANVRRSHGWNR
jgi:hypothetical protein